MSEDFDKEAERKRLREKYEAEREDREATERMSELLLQGATMTNKHCDVCGSPIFRYQGQAFCPNCQEERGEGTSSERPGSAEPPAGDESATGATTGTSGTAQQSPGTGVDEQPADSDAMGSRSAEGQPPVDEQPAGGDRTESRTPTQPASGSVEEAQAALVRTLTNLTRRAEQTDDPRQAKELLAAAREAAETLARLRGR